MTATIERSDDLINSNREAVVGQPQTGRITHLQKIQNVALTIIADASKRRASAALPDRPWAAPRPVVILCVNSGSSSLKFAFYEFGTAEKCLVAGAVEDVGLPHGRLWAGDAVGSDSVLDSACTVRVMQTDENLMIARHTWALLGGRA